MNERHKDTLENIPEDACALYLFWRMLQSVRSNLVKLNSFKMKECPD